MQRLFLCLLLILPLAAHAQDGLPADKIGPDIESIQSGVVCAPEVVGTTEAPGTVAGVTNVINSDPPFVTEGQYVPAVLGIGFGMKTQAIDPLGISNVMITVTHPPMGPEGMTQQRYFTSISGFAPSLTLYQFDYGYELLPGLWTFEASVDNTMLFRASFQVVPPQALPDLASICGFENLLG